MKFQNRLIRFYTIFLLLMSIALGLVFYHYSFEQKSIREIQTLESSASRTMNSVLDMLRIMEYRTDTLLASPQVLDSLKSLSTSENYSDFEITEILKTLSQNLIADSVLSSFYRILVFDKDYAIYARQCNNYISQLDFDLSEIPQKETIDRYNGTPYIITGHTDNWGKENKPVVFSLIRKVVGTNMGYIEVQELLSALGDKLDNSSPYYKTLVFVNNGDFLYGNADTLNSSNYQEFYNNSSDAISIDGIEYRMVSKDNEEFGLKVVTFISTEDLMSSLKYLIVMVFSLVLIFFLVAVSFVLISSKFLTKPIRQISNIMENTTSTEKKNDIKLDTDVDEVLYLGETYQRLLARLNSTLEKDKELVQLQADAQYCMLQSQINPHFMYNILNVISARGIEDEDEEICEICGYLADMLRYSTNTKDKYASLQQEVSYLNSYLQLLKARYEDSMEFTIDVDPSINSVKVPKIILQQFAENSFCHGFKDMTDNMKFTVTGKRIKNHVVFELSDNGCGLTEEKMQEIKDGIKNIHNAVTNNKEINLKIGGMGILNTYARLLIFKKDSLIFNVINNNKSGVTVHIEFEEG